ncbi:DUF2834 domain-containing protein [Marinomonas sp. C2222]|uniref:DUF2834 domain-containing protein n=1 Tax=Marinomonas sargassi TaxID=2984494 RepID=A0ABT2YNX7_9GAMM|nr:DUF2834 domain-containing protein [Marinomonas sargassi]MCV2401589.1 DUF2834 domain-containing protein [Marinomonas sargassi]
MKVFYLVCSVFGVVLPYGAFMPWLFHHGVDIALFIESALVTPISVFAWLDVLVSAIALLGFIIIDGKRSRVPYRYWAVLGTLTIGVSFGLPFYLYLKERRTDL